MAAKTIYNNKYGVEMVQMNVSIRKEQYDHIVDLARKNATNISHVTRAIIDKSMGE
jgi:hypothetical protein